MDPIKNPFSPGACSPPPELVGRGPILEQARILLGRTKQKKSEESLLLTGLRGVGKTVLLNEIERLATADAYRNKRVIKAQSPAAYIKAFQIENEHLDRTLAGHLIGKPESFGILDNDYEAFFRKRCRKFSVELKKRILPVEADSRMTATPASETADAWAIEDDVETDT